MINFYALARPALFLFPPEKAHALTLRAMKMGLMPSFKAAKDGALESTLFGLKFPNPVGMSAGFDKNAEVIGASFNMGFGFVEVGTVTPKPQEGNPQPRIFRDVANDAVINRMGFPNGGMEVFKANLEAFLSRKKRPSGVVGLNIGMNKTQAEPAKDYATLIRMLGPMADYITINISSPNTPGLRDLQKREPLLELIAAVKNAREKACGAHPPALLVKLAPDLDEAQQAEMAQTLMDGGVDGVILGNTTLDRPESLP
jgi:dihydroorotate dehydrogenase